MNDHRTFAKRWLGGIFAIAGVLGITSAFAKEALPQEILVRGVEFVLIPAGPFFRQAGLKSEEVRQSGTWSEVSLPDYYIAKYEARARDLVPFMNANRIDPRWYAGDFESCSMRRGKDGKYVQMSPHEDLPATHLSWALADAWAKGMGFRLPTELEWEKAARGTDRRMYPWGDDSPDETYANFLVGSSCFVWPVDRSAKGRSPYGVFNLSGNIREYVANWAEGEGDPGYVAFKEDQANQARRGQVPERTGPARLLKGGRWASNADQITISVRLGWADEEEGFQCNGTRFALDADRVRELLAKGEAKVIRP